jgi:orotate phosphoribosyltransferase
VSNSVESTVGDVLKTVGAWRTGHFLLSSGLHSNQYVQCQRVLQFPRFGNLLADLLAEKLESQNIEVEVVIGPALGAVHWELFVAGAIERRRHQNELGSYYLDADTVGGAVSEEQTSKMVKAVFAERAQGSVEFSLRRGIELERGQKVLIVEDVTTTGGSARQVVQLVRDLGGKPVAVGAIADRSGGSATFDVPFVSLLQMNLATYKPEECPLCKSGSVAEKPGSSKK